MEERTFRCANCKAELMFFEVHRLPGVDIFDEISGIRYDTGQNYCKDCYEGMLGKNLIKDLNEAENTEKLIEENRQIFEEYFRVKKEWDELDKKKNELGLKIKELMISNNLPKISLNKFELIVWKSKSVHYLKKVVEQIVPEDLLNKIRTIKETTFLKIKPKN